MLTDNTLSLAELIFAWFSSAARGGRELRDCGCWVSGEDWETEGRGGSELGVDSGDGETAS